MSPKKHKNERIRSILMAILDEVNDKEAGILVKKDRKTWNPEYLVPISLTVKEIWSAQDIIDLT